MEKHDLFEKGELIYQHCLSKISMIEKLRFYFNSKMKIVKNCFFVRLLPVYWIFFIKETFSFWEICFGNMSASQTNFEVRNFPWSIQKLIKRTFHEHYQISKHFQANLWSLDKNFLRKRLKKKNWAGKLVLSLTL